MASLSYMQDIEPTESISQIGITESESVASSSRITSGLTSSDTAFRSHFGSKKGFWERYLIITNDPVTLMRSESLLQVRTPDVPDWLPRRSSNGCVSTKKPSKILGHHFMKLSTKTTRVRWRFARNVSMSWSTRTPKKIEATRICGSIFVRSTKRTPVPFLKLKIPPLMLSLHALPVSPLQNCNACCFRRWQHAIGHLINSTTKFFDTSCTVGSQDTKYLDVKLWRVFENRGRDIKNRD